MNIDLRKIGGRGAQSLFISIILHLIGFILTGFFMLSQSQVREEVATYIDIFKSSSAKLKHKPPPPKRKFRPKKISSRTQTSSSVHKISEVIKWGPQPVISDASLEKYSQKDDIIPDVTTIAKKLRTNKRDIRISSPVGTGNKPSSGNGILSSRQRAGGSGKGKGEGGYGLGMANTIGAKDLDTNVLEEIPPKKEPRKELTAYGEALSLIAEHMAGNSLTGSVDVIFVIDTSMSMQDNIDKVASNLYSMIETYDKYEITYRLGVVEFSVRRKGNKIEMDPLITDPGLLQRKMRRLSLSGNEHALDALTKTLTHMEFSSNSDKNLILVTDESASTGWDAPNAYKLLRSRIITDCRSEQIAVNVLGCNRSYQKRLAKETGGLWVEIPGGERGKSPTSSRKSTKDSSKKAKLMNGFRRIAQHISRKAQASNKAADIVIAVDFSSSMGSKAPLVINGIQSMLNVLKFTPSEYKTGMIRFATKSTIGAIDGVVVTKIPIKTDTVISLLQSPFGGDEDLLDAVVEGIPQINFGSNTERFLVIVTDEPSTGKYTTEKALEVCQDNSVHVCVVGSLPADVDEKDFDSRTEILNDDFQFQAVNQTGGLFWPMPNSLKSPDSEH